MNPVIAEIFSQGEEVVSGQTVDSNAAWLSQCLSDLGFSVRRHTAVGDRLDDLIALFAEIAERADCCICSGGLGPTVDDLTREAVSQATGLPLQFDALAMRNIADYFARRHRDMPEVNRNQAYLPAGATMIENPLGSAPGFALLFKRCWFAFLPGVPSEMKSMFPAVEQLIQQRFTLQADSLVTIRSIGLGESAIQQRLHDLQLPDGVRLGFRAASDEVQTKLLFTADFAIDQRQSLSKNIADRLGEHVFAIDTPEHQDGDLVEVIDRLMRKNGWTLSVLETASQGMIGAKCLGRSWLSAGCYSANPATTARQWRCDYLDDQPAESARLLAQQLKQQSADGCQLVQLYRGDMAEPKQSVQLYSVLLTPQGAYQSTHSVAGSPQNKQNQSAVLALDLLRRTLQTSSCL